MHAAMLVALVTVAASPQRTVFNVSDANFIISTRSRELSDQLLLRAGDLRRELSLLWLGRELPEGTGAAIIHVELTGDEDVGLTSPATRPGRRRHVVWLKTSRERALDTTLAHEMTHVVLATEYGEALPVWANEGAAGLQDDAERQEARRRQLALWASRGRWPAVDDVLSSRGISPGDGQSYTVAVSLTRYLLSLGSRSEFLAFARDGKRGGWNAALQQHYGMRDVGTLAGGWQRWAEAQVRGDARTARSSTPRRIR